MQHPRDIGAPRVNAFLSMLAIERKVSASTHNQVMEGMRLRTKERVVMLPRSLAPAPRMQLLAARAAVCLHHAHGVMRNSVG